jgi:hypothetical protein
MKRSVSRMPYAPEGATGIYIYAINNVSKIKALLIVWQIIN